MALTVPALHAEPLIQLENGSFEMVPSGKGWRLPKAWSVVSGAGRNGSKAVVWDNDDQKHYTFPFQQLKAYPGARFRIHGWVKVERVLPVGLRASGGRA